MNINIERYTTSLLQGLESEYDDQGVSLGNYTYNDNGKPMQFFPIQVRYFTKL